MAASSVFFKQAEKCSFKERGLPCLALKVQRTSAGELQWKRNMGWLFLGAGRNLFGLFVWDLAECAGLGLDSDATTIWVMKAIMPHGVQRR